MLDQETKDELKALMKEAVREVLASNGEQGPPPVNPPADDVEVISALDALGRVTLRRVELFQESLGKSIKGADRDFARMIPKYFFVQESMNKAVTELQRININQNCNRAFMMTTGLGANLPAWRGWTAVEYYKPLFSNKPAEKNLLENTAAYSGGNALNGEWVAQPVKAEQILDNIKRAHADYVSVGIRPSWLPPVAPNGKPGGAL